MVNYNCLRCGYTTNIKTIMLRHYNRKKLCNAVLHDIDINLLKENLLNDNEGSIPDEMGSKPDGIGSNESKMTQKPAEFTQKPAEFTQKPAEFTQKPTEFTQKHAELTQNYAEFTQKHAEIKCEYCKKIFTRKDSLPRHLKTCKLKKEDEEDKKNLMNLVDMLNEQLIKRDKQIDEQNKQIQELIKKAGVNIGTQNIQQNIKILAYKNTDLSHLTDQDYLQCLNRSNMVIPHLIKKIHFNPEKPENHNIYISNIKNKYLMIYDGDKWTLSNKNETIDDLIDTNEVVIEQKLEEWLENGKEYPQIMKKFKRYLEKKESDEVKNAIKEEIRLILYNNRKTNNNQIE